MSDDLVRVEKRFESLAHDAAVRSIHFATKSFLVLGSLILLGGVVQIATGGLWEALYFIPPLVGVAVGATMFASVRRGTLSARAFYLPLTVITLLPAVRSVIAWWQFGPEGVASYLHSPDPMMLMLVIITCGMFLNQRATVFLGALSVVQYLALYLFARPGLASLSGPEILINGIQTEHNLFGRLGMLALATVFVHQTAAVVRRALRQAVDEETQRHEQVTGRLLAERESEAKSVFLAHINHELRTPLNAVLGYTQILLNRDDLNPEQRDGLEVIGDSGGHLLGLINDVLDLSKIEAGRMEVDPVPVHLPELLEGVIATLRARADLKGISLELRVEPTVPEGVVVDDKRLRQVLLNLVGNAVKFTERGGVLLRVAAADGGSVEFVVKDTGPGIPVDQREVIFEPFRQVGRRVGTGLGLPISQELVRAMGGEIEVESELGEGSAFRFSLTLEAAPEMKRSRREPRVVGYRGKVRTILVADDRRLNRLLLEKLLTQMGFQVVLTADGAAAVDAYRAAPPDLVLMDLQMPVMSGLEAAIALRSEWGAAVAPIVAVTAHAGSLAAREEARDPFDDLLAKPVDLATLQASLATQLALVWDTEDTVAARAPAPLRFDLPPSAQARLRELLRVGDLLAVQDEVSDLARADASLQPLADRVSTLVREFDDAALSRLFAPAP